MTIDQDRVKEAISKNVYMSTNSSFLLSYLNSFAEPS